MCATRDNRSRPAAAAEIEQIRPLGKPISAVEERRKLIGDFELNVAFCFARTPYEVLECGLKLFAKEVLPVLKAQASAEVRAAAE